MIRWALAAAALLLAGSPAHAGKACPPAEERYIAGLLVTAGGNVALFIASFRGPMTTAHVECLARRGDKAMVLELGRRYEAGLGVAADVERAEELYAAAARTIPGTIAVYVPGVGKAPGRVQMIRTGPTKPGLPEANYRRAMMHIEGRARKPSFRKGLKLLKQSAKADYAPAAEMLQKIKRETV